MDQFVYISPIMPILHTSVKISIFERGPERALFHTQRTTVNFNEERQCFLNWKDFTKSTFHFFQMYHTSGLIEVSVLENVQWIVIDKPRRPSSVPSYMLHKVFSMSKWRTRFERHIPRTKACSGGGYLWLSEVIQITVEKKTNIPCIASLPSSLFI